MMKIDHEESYRLIRNHFNTREREYSRVINENYITNRLFNNERGDQKTSVHEGLFRYYYTIFEETRWWILFPWKEIFMDFVLAILTGAIIFGVIVTMSIGIVASLGWVLSLHGWAFALVIIPLAVIFTIIGGIISQ